MPKDKDLKRVVRARMLKTGEAYTTARAQVVAKAVRGSADGGARPDARQAPPSPAPDYASLAGMSDAAVQAKTGRGWAEWVALLDQAGAAQLPHRDIARLLADEHGVPGWWSQTVSVGYERVRGLRDIGQQRGGSYEVSKSKTVAAPVGRLYRSFSSARGLASWLAGVKPVIRRATPEKSLRYVWPDGTKVEAYIAAKGETKSLVAIQHRGLESKAEAARLKAWWGERLAVLAEKLASKPRGG